MARLFGLEIPRTGLLTLGVGGKDKLARNEADAIILYRSKIALECSRVGGAFFSAPLSSRKKSRYVCLHNSLRVSSSSLARLKPLLLGVVFPCAVSERTCHFHALITTFPFVFARHSALIPSHAEQIPRGVPATGDDGGRETKEATGVGAVVKIGGGDGGCNHGRLKKCLCDLRWQKNSSRFRD